MGENRDTMEMKSLGYYGMAPTIYFIFLIKVEGIGSISTTL